MSPSSRRAWIEIRIVIVSQIGMRVALLAEGVDRNEKLMEYDADLISRPPRGGRG